MKKILSAITVSMSVMMAASTAMAAPQEHANHHNPATQQHQNKPQHSAPHGAAVKKVATHNKAQHAQHWKVGNQYPNQYRGAGYKVDYKHNKKLSKPGHNQQWYQADGKYVLVNTANYGIIKVLGL